ncbi:hypothetical protein MXAN_6596 [Myxococcus xanthus DK 1622]|uniref:Uncharacterized protein n=1 Tax=Myxococcus xanthus (strain DK1622) TaxID=246197 RepID=Q1CY07_MYXXD|nr:hypothetical protein MXAN_6596 [Myxococcus xanthus DK 1622]
MPAPVKLQGWRRREGSRSREAVVTPLVVEA